MEAKADMWSLEEIAACGPGHGCQAHLASACPIHGKRSGPLRTGEKITPKYRGHSSDSWQSPADVTTQRHHDDLGASASRGEIPQGIFI
jgi:hypothetical protein